MYGLSLKQLNREDCKLLKYKKPSFVETCEYSTIVNNIWNTEISDEVDIDKSIKKIINNVVIGQLERGINKAQSSCAFHTLEEARGYQTLNGGTLNTITRESEITTVEIHDKCPMMDVIEYDRIYDERQYTTNNEHISIKRIVGSKRIEWENGCITNDRL